MILFYIDNHNDEPYYREKIWLRSSSLLSKFGFGDGGICSHAVLIFLVRKHLAPLLDKRVVLQEYCTSHNPIRATDETMQYVDENILVLATYPSDAEVKEARKLYDF